MNNPPHARAVRLQSSDYYFLGMLLVCSFVVVAHWDNYRHVTLE
jgi:hypothetical protein